jgi:hypothetical protein
VKASKGAKKYDTWSHPLEEYYAAVSLRVRDLRRLDFYFNPVEENSVTVRRHAVIFCLEPIR